jgi:O-antigen ligase/tetratricopeptide (TPR) repeat protein
LITALIVARPLVLGEDPGLLDRLSGWAGLVLSLLWLFAAAGWAVWRAWSGQTAWRASAVEACLLAAVVLVFFSAAAAASYKHPAWLIASEWFVLLVAFCLVRQLAITPGDNHCLLAVLLATGVSLSLHGIYQYLVEFPEHDNEAANPGQLVQTLAQTGIYLDPKDPLLEHWQKRVQADNAFATFANPNSFAGFLALLFPLAIGWLLVSISSQGWRSKTGLVLGCSVAMAAALWFTHSRGAILATLLIAVLIAAVHWRHVLWTHKWKCLAGLTVLSALIILPFAQGWFSISGMEKVQFSKTKRLDYWAATWAMIRDHSWLGVGPGQFGRFYPRYLRETAFEKITNPHNFALEMWSTCGFFALVAVGAAFIAFFWRTRSVWVERGAGPANGEAPLLPRWEFYLGAMAGLILGFVLWTQDLSGDNLGDQMIYGGFKAGIRALFWFGCFALFESIPWSGPSRTLALTAGFAALLLNLLVSDGISLPSVAQPLWIVAALAVNTLSQPVATLNPKNWLGIMAPIPILAVIWLAYLLFLFDPTVTSCDSLGEGRRLYAHYREKMQELKELGQQKPAPDTKTVQDLQNLVTRLRAAIPTSLHVAAYGNSRQRQKPFRAEPLVDLAEWFGEEWNLRQAPMELRQRAAQYAEAAIKLDPEGLEGYRIKYQLNLMFAKGSTTETKRFHELASEALKVLVRKDPTEAANHFQLADVLFKLGDQTAGKNEAQEALRLDQVSTDLARKLKQSQRQQLLARLDPDNVLVHYQLAEALYREGDKEGAEREAEQTLRLDRQHTKDAGNSFTDWQRRNAQDWARPKPGAQDAGNGMSSK